MRLLRGHFWLLENASYGVLSALETTVAFVPDDDAVDTLPVAVVVLAGAVWVTICDQFLRIAFATGGPPYTARNTSVTGTASDFTMLRTVEHPSRNTMKARA